MKKKLKLAFELLESELTTLTKDEQRYFLGGDGSGLGPNSTISDVVDYFSNLGMTFTQDSNGNYYSEGYQMMDPVTVTANYGGYGYSGDYSGSSGDSSGNSSGDGTEDYSALVYAYKSYFESLGYTFTAGGGGGSDPFAYLSSPPVGGKAGFVYTLDGDIVGSPTGNTMELFYPMDDGAVLTLREVKLTRSDGRTVTAYEVTKAVVDGNELTGSNIPDRYKSNCLGYALGNADYWFINDLDTTGFDEVIQGGMMQYVKDNYIECPESEAQLCIMYTSAGEPIHAGVKVNGTYYAKDGAGNPAGSYSDYASFSANYSSASTPKFYKPK